MIALYWLSQVVNFQIMVFFKIQNCLKSLSKSNSNVFMIAFRKKVYLGSGRPREFLVRKNIFCEITPKKRKYHSNHVYSKFFYFELWIKVLSALYFPLADKKMKNQDPGKHLNFTFRELKSPKKYNKYLTS